MPEKRWKRFERDVAAPGGGARIPVSGRNPGDPDVILPWLPGFFVEVRDRMRPRPLRWMREVWAKAHARGERPLVIFKADAPHLSPLVLLRWADFERVVRDGQDRPGAGPAAAGEGGRAPGGARAQGD